MKFNSTARLTNSITATGFRSFNRWGGITYEDILSNYPTALIDKCWWSFSRSIIENYQMGKGTFVKGLGTFTFTHNEYLLSGTTNHCLRDNRVSHPVFIASPEFVDYIKPGQYNPNSGLIYYTQKNHLDIPVCKFNYALCSYGVNISKEEFITILNTIIKNMGDQIRRGVFKEKIIPDLGTFIIRGNVFGIKFNDDLFVKNILKTDKMRRLKENMNLAMETRQSQGWRQRDIEDIDQAERDVRPEKAVITHVSKDGDKWLKNKLNIDVKKIEENIREDLLVRTPKSKKEYLVDQRYYRDYPKQNLGNLKIPLDILEAIVNKKFLIMREMKVYDRHDNGIILKCEFINAMKDANVHFRLRRELIGKIVDLYTGTDPSNNTVNYHCLMKIIEEDMKNLIKTEYQNFPIEKYKNTIAKDNKRSTSAYAFCRQTGNLSNKAISTRNNYNRFLHPLESEIKEDIDKIQINLNNLPKFRKMISFLELMNIFEKNGISVPKIQILKILKYLNLDNPNCFNYMDFIKRIQNVTFRQN